MTTSSVYMGTPISAVMTKTKSAFTKKVKAYGSALRNTVCIKWPRIKPELGWMTSNKDGTPITQNSNKISLDGVMGYGICNTITNSENKMVKINNILFEKLDDFVLTVNKLTDIAEELLEDNYEGSNEI